MVYPMSEESKKLSVQLLKEIKPLLDSGAINAVLERMTHYLECSWNQGFDDCRAAERLQRIGLMTMNPRKT